MENREEEDKHLQDDEFLSVFDLQFYDDEELQKI
jgi:hypothetical protein